MSAASEQRSGSGISSGIEAARFVLAGAVALFHWNGSLPNAYLAVDLFFIISGLVIGGRYEAAQRAGVSMAGFAIGRAIRLYPLYLLGLATGLASHAIDPMVTPDWSHSLPGLVWRGLLMVPVLDPDARPAGMQSFPLDVPAWSLWCEVLANALFCVLCRMPRWMMAVPALLGVAILVATAFSPPYLTGGGDARTVVTGLGRIGFSFFAGVLLSRLRLVPVLSGRVAGIALAALLGTLVVYFRVTETRADTALSVLFLLVVVFPALTLCVASCHVRGPAGRLAIAAGGLSYAIYILHWPLLRIVRSVGAAYALDAQTVQGAGGTIAAALLLIGSAYLATQHFDRPLRSYLNALRGPRRRPAAADVSSGLRARFGMRCTESTGVAFRAPKRSDHEVVSIGAEKSRVRRPVQ